MTSPREQKPIISMKGCEIVQVGIVVTEKLAEQAGVVEVKLRAFDHPSVEIPVVGEKQEDDETGL